MMLVKDLKKGDLKKLRSRCCGAEIFPDLTDGWRGHVFHLATIVCLKCHNPCEAIKTAGKK